MNVALPAIAGELGASPARAVLLANAYHLAIAIALFPLAAIGDRVGYRVVYVGGLLLLIATSIASGLAPNFGALLFARAMQGFAAAGVMSVSSALMRHIYPTHLLGGGIGIQAAIVATASASGPLVGGLILQIASWRWIFSLGPLLGIAALIGAQRSLPAAATIRENFDRAGAALSSLTIGLFIVALNGLSLGWPAAAMIVVAVLVPASAHALMRHESRCDRPLFPVDLLRRPLFRLSIATAGCSFVAQMLALVTLPFYLHQSLGLSIATAGYCLTPWPLALVAMAPLAGKLSDRFSAGRLGGSGLLLVAAGLLLLAQLKPGAAIPDILWRMALCGAGFGCFQSPNNRLIILSSPVDRTSAAGAMIGTVRLTGQLTGASLAAILLAMSGHDHYRIALYVAAAFAACAAAVSMSRLLVTADSAPDR